MPLISTELSFKPVTEVGLMSTRSVLTIYKDKHEFVWFGTDKGLFKFDGYHLIDYQLPTSGNKDIKVTSFAEVNGDVFYIGTSAGLYTLDISSNKEVFGRTMSNEIGSINCLAGIEGKKILVGTDNGLGIITNGGKVYEPINVSSNILSEANVVHSIAVAGDVAYIGTKNGLYSLSLQDYKMELLAGKSQGIDNVSSVHYLNGKIYLGNLTTGIRSYDLKRGTVSAPLNIGCNVVSEIKSDSKGYLYIATDGAGVVKYDPRTEKVVDQYGHKSHTDAVLRSNQVYSLLIDNKDLIWTGYYQRGADYTLYNSGLFHVYNNYGFNSDGVAVRTININKPYMAIGTREGLVVVNTESGAIKYLRKQEIRSDMVLAVAYIGDEYYIGTYGGGITVYNPKSQTVRDFDSNIPTPMVTGFIFCITEGNDGSIWVGTSNGVFRYLEGKCMAQYTENNSKLPAGNVYDIFFDSTGKGWITTESGMAIWDDKAQKIRTDVFPKGFFNDENIRSIYEDNNKQLYFVSKQGEISKSDLTMRNFTQGKPQIKFYGEITCRDIVEDSKGYLWITTSNGIYRYDKNQEITMYDFSDGLPSLIFNQCTPAVDSDGVLWFGNSQGLLSLDTSTSTNNALENSHVLASGLVINKAQIAIVQRPENSNETEIKLDKYESTITINLTDFSYTESQVTRYEYKLNGEAEWQPVENMTITLYDLSHGTNELIVRQINREATEQVFYIKMPHNYSAIFVGIVMFLLVGIICVVLIYGYHLLKRHGLLHKIFKRQKAIKESSAVEEAIEMPEVAESESDAEPSKAKYQSNNISTEECERIEKKMNKLFSTTKIYTNPELKLGEVAEKLGISSMKLSYVFSQHLHKNYYDYVNEYRIAEFKRLVASSDANKYTLIALSEQAGFSSRASFFRNFKKLEGIAPGEYIKGVKNEE